MDAFQSVQEEIDWAKSRINEATQLFSIYLQQKPFALVVENDPETGNITSKVKRTVDPPVQITHLLRNAMLDIKHSYDRALHVAARSVGRTQFDRTYPWADSVVGVKKIIRQRQRKPKTALPPEIIREILRQKPYSSSPARMTRQNLVREIAHMANEKHSFGIVVGAEVGGIAIDGGFMAGILRMAQPWDPVKNEMIVFELAPDGVAMHPKITITPNISLISREGILNVAAHTALMVFSDHAQSCLEGFKAVCSR